MLASPEPGTLCQVWYNRRVAPSRPLHGKVGVVVVRSKGKPRNHGVSVDGVWHVVPCGNLRKPEVEATADEA